MFTVGRRITTWVLLSSYLFVVTAAGVLHRHGRDACGDAGHRGETATADDGISLEAGEEHGAGSASHDCVICQFLSQKNASAPSRDFAQMAAVAPFAVTARPVVAPHLSLLLKRTRAPPPTA